MNYNKVSSFFSELSSDSRMILGLSLIFGLGIIFFCWLVMFLSKIFILKKAGRNPWIVLIPFYGAYVFCDIATDIEWFSIIYCLSPLISSALGFFSGYITPLAMLVMNVILNINLAKKFDKGSGFAIGLTVLPIIFYPILAFDKSKYIPVGQEKNNNDDSYSKQNQTKNNYDEFNDFTHGQEINFSSNNNKDDEDEEQ